MEAVLNFGGERRIQSLTISIFNLLIIWIFILIDGVNVD